MPVSLAFFSRNISIYMDKEQEIKGLCVQDKLMGSFLSQKVIVGTVCTHMDAIKHCKVLDIWTEDRRNSPMLYPVRLESRISLVHRVLVLGVPHNEWRS